jgi:GNAT superfamily N-acetyltransferase
VLCSATLPLFTASSSWRGARTLIDVTTRRLSDPTGGETEAGNQVVSVQRLPEIQIAAIAPSSRLLAASFRIRYEVYRGLGYVADCAAALDVDEYDACALPLGALDTATRELVGVLRVISTRPHRDYRAAVERVVAQAACPALSARAGRPRSSILPSIVSREVARALEAAGGHGLPTRELSRCIVRPDRRGAGVSRALIELGMALAWREGPAVLIGGCLTEHLSMYARYGFRPLRDVGDDYFARVGQRAHVTICRPDDVPEPTRSRVAGIASSAGLGDATFTGE